MQGGSDNRILIFVAFIVFIDMVGLGLILPVMPALIGEVADVSVDRAAEIGGMLHFAFAIMQFFFAPIIAGLSDRFGRRPVLLITLFLLGVDYAIMAWAPSLAWLFFGRVVSGIMGASWAAANSCIADIARPEDRGKMFGLLGGFGALGFVIGPALGGILGEYDARLPFVVAAVLALLGTAAGIFVLKQTLPQDKRRRFTIARANPLGSIIQMAKTPLVLGFILTIFTLQLAVQAQFLIWAFWLIERFGWSIGQIGWSVALYGILLVLVQGGLTGPIIKKFGESKAAIFGLFFGLPAYLLFAFAPQDAFVYVGIVIGALSGFAFPAMQQMMSARIDEDAQGELQGAIASTVSLTSVIGPIIMTTTFGMFADKQGLYFPGAPFLLGAGLMLVALAISVVTIQRHYRAG